MRIVNNRRFILDSLLCLTYGLEEAALGLFDVPEIGYRELARLYERIADCLDNYGVVNASDYSEASHQFSTCHEFLFHDQHLGVFTNVFQQFSETQRNILVAIASLQWDRFRSYLQDINNPRVHETALDHILKTIQNFNTVLRDYLRGFMLDAVAFRTPEMRQRMKEDPYIEKLGFGFDTDLREKIKEQFPRLYDLDGNPKPPGLICDHCSAVCDKLHPSVSALDDNVSDTSESDISDGDTSNNTDDWISFPGSLNGHSVNPLIDTGGGANLVSKSWLEANGITFTPDPDKREMLLNPDGTVSEELDVISCMWKYDDRETQWKNVEFIVTTKKHGPDVLLGLKFLKLSEVIHTSGGKLLFPEISNLPRKRAPIPLYNAW